MLPYRDLAAFAGQIKPGDRIKLVFNPGTGSRLNMDGNTQAAVTYLTGMRGDILDYPKTTWGVLHCVYTSGYWDLDSNRSVIVTACDGFDPEWFAERLHLGLESVCNAADEPIAESTPSRPESPFFNRGNSKAERQAQLDELKGHVEKLETVSQLHSAGLVTSVTNYVSNKHSYLHILVLRGVKGEVQIYWYQQGSHTNKLLTIQGEHRSEKNVSIDEAASKIAAYLHEIYGEH